MDNELRVNYSKLWLALMKPNQSEILRIGNAMGLADYSNLFACIVTLRSWRSINSGYNIIFFLNQCLLIFTDFCIRLSVNVTTFKNTIITKL